MKILLMDDTPIFLEGLKNFLKIARLLLRKDPSYQIGLKLTGSKATRHGMDYVRRVRQQKPSAPHGSNRTVFITGFFMVVFSLTVLPARMPLSLSVFEPVRFTAAPEIRRTVVGS